MKVESLSFKRTYTERELRRAGAVFRSGIAFVLFRGLASHCVARFYSSKRYSRWMLEGFGTLTAGYADSVFPDAEREQLARLLAACYATAIDRAWVERKREQYPDVQPTSIETLIAQGA
jgi:hypothetical protein